MQLKMIRKSVIASCFCLLSLTSINTAQAAPKVIFKDIYNKHPGFSSKMPQAISGFINHLENEKPDLYQIVTYKMKDHYLIYQLSGKKWSAHKIRVDLDQKGNVSQVTDPYEGDDAEIEDAKEHYAGKCPDESVQFVAISAYPGVGAVNRAIQIVSEAAKKRYKTKTILSEKADGKIYKDWLSCSGLKGFYSVSHGSNTDIMVGNGDIISYKFFADQTFINKYRSTTIIFNACEVYNYPFGPQMMFGNAARASDYVENPGPNAFEFMGGHVDLLMEASELSSACFMAQAIMGSEMNYKLLKDCIGSRDLHYQNFGLSKPGKYLDDVALIAD